MWNISTLFFPHPKEILFQMCSKSLFTTHSWAAAPSMNHPSYLLYWFIRIFTKFTWRDFIFYRFQSKSIKKTICHSGACGSSNTFQIRGNIDWNSDSAAGWYTHLLTLRTLFYLFHQNLILFTQLASVYPLQSIIIISFRSINTWAFDFHTVTLLILRIWQKQTGTNPWERTQSVYSYS